MFKYAIVTLLILIIYNLVMGFIYILKDKSSSRRGLASLKTRIILSLAFYPDYCRVLHGYDKTK